MGYYGRRNYSRPRRERAPEITIEPKRGATYGPSEEAPYAAYEYSTYGRGSVLAGQQRRVFLDDGTLEELKAKYPKADVMAGSLYQPPSLNHLPDEDDPRTTDEYFSREYP